MIPQSKIYFPPLDNTYTLGKKARSQPDLTAEITVRPLLIRSS